MKELPEPFGSPPGRPAKYVFYITRHRDDDTQGIVVAFAAKYAARKFLDELLQDDGIIWEDAVPTPTGEHGCTIRSESGIIVSTRWWPGRLRECVEHEYSLQEMAWDLRGPPLAWARHFRNGPDLPRTLEDSPGHKERAERRQKSSGPTVAHPTGAVHVSDLALSLGIDARDARRALRSIMQKPAYGWWFKPEEIEEVKAKIKAQVEA